MTTLTLSKKRLFSPPLSGNGVFPGMRELIPYGIKTDLSEFEGLFINFGRISDPLPFTMQDQYDEPAKEVEYPSIELENEYLKATFLPDFGGRLWSLYDKKAKRDLLLDNTSVMPNNLAIRNAWCAGGIEYNIGRRGHDEQTCSRRFAAVLKDSDDTPVLRFYEFNRDRAIPFQIDFYLPEKSRFLFARVSIKNIHEKVVPMYFWSNIAVPQLPGCRVIVPTFETYSNIYDGGSHSLTNIPMPDGEGFDGSYPENFPVAKDLFFNIPDDVRKYETVMFQDGYGLLFASTKRLQGRKLFVWGENAGGKHWQRKLVPDDLPDYIEIQGGLAKTQFECLPMPPETTWEHLEAYGAISMPPEDCFNSWERAVEASNKLVDEILPASFLEEELLRTRKSFAAAPGKVIFQGSPWGALEEKRRGSKMANHLDFGDLSSADVAPWVELLEKCSMPETFPCSYLVQDEWFELLKKAKQNWLTLFHLALNYFHRDDLDAAESCINKSIALQKNAFNTFALANIFRNQGKIQEALELFSTVIFDKDSDISVVKECFKVFIEQQLPAEKMLSLWEKLPLQYQEKPIFQFFHAYALAYSGNLDAAEAILMQDGGLEVGDIREGEISITDLYIYIQIAKAEKEGKVITARDVEIPFKLDMRMKL